MVYIAGMSIRTVLSVAITIAAFVGSLGFGSRAHAWGMLPDLNAKWRPSYLIYPVLRHHWVNYCISLKPTKDANGNVINPGHFSASSIGEQTRFALGLWLKAVHDLTGPVAVRQVECDDNNLNLEVSIGPSDRHFVMSNAENYFGYFYHVYINTKYSGYFKWNSQFYNVRINDFQYLVDKYLPGLSLEYVMAHADMEKMGQESLAKWANVSTPYVHFSSYPALIHEFGHAFGLCDTDDNPQDYDCDPNHVSVASPVDQPLSVMASDGYFYLAPDDIAGVRAVFHRFSWISQTK